MTERQARLGVDLFTALVAASIGVALAGLSWRLAGDPGGVPGALPLAPRPAPAFDATGLIALAPFGAASAGRGGGVTASATGPLVLKGILLAESPAASTALISVGGAPATPFSPGSAIDGGTILSIARDHVVIAGAGGQQVLAFPDAGASAPGLAPPPAPAPAPPPDGAALLGTLGAAPAPGGFRVGPQAGALAIRSGLQPGDVIERINGVPADQAQQNGALLAQAMAAGVARVDVRRGGQALTLSIPLR